MILDLPKFEADLLKEIVFFLSPNENKQVWLVGGTIRDLLRGKETCYDLDLTLNYNPIKSAKEFARKTNSGVVILDEERHIVRIVREAENGLMYTFDLSEFRADNIDSDLKARDFTINAMAAPLFGEGLSLLKENKISVYDPLEGVLALEENRIEACSEDLFLDDPLRIMRAFRFSALYNSSLSYEIIELIKKQKDLLKSVSGERIRDELFKIFTVSESYKWIKQIDEVGLLEIILPELQICHGVTQNEWHHLDVFDHSLLALEKLEALINIPAPYPWWSDFSSYLFEIISGPRGYLQLLKFASLIHDIGKIPCREVDPVSGKVSFHRHEVEGAKQVKEISEKFKLSGKESNYLQNVIKNHMRPGIIFQQGITDKKLYRFYSECGRDGLGVCLLCLADRLSALGDNVTEDELIKFSAAMYQIMDEFYQQLNKPKIKQFLNGNDLINIFKLTPGPIIKTLLLLLEEGQYAGEIASKEDAINFVQDYIKNNLNQD